MRSSRRTIDLRLTVTTLLLATLHCIICLFSGVMWALRTLRSPLGSLESTFGGHQNSANENAAEYVQEISLYRNLGVLADILSLVLKSQRFFLYLIRTPELRQGFLRLISCGLLGPPRAMPYQGAQMEGPSRIHLNSVRTHSNEEARIRTHVDRTNI